MGIDQLVILLIIGAISLVNWLIRKSAEMREKKKLERNFQQGGPSEEPELIAREKNDGAPDESMRRLMEALGLPVDETPPVLSRPPPLPVPEPVAPKTTPPPVVRKSLVPPRAVAVKKPTVAKRVTPRVRSRVMRLLSHREGVRDGIILAEVLGPPKALQAKP